MRKFIFFLIVFVLAVWAGLKIAHDPGYTLLVYRQWSIEMPLWLAFAVLFAAFIFFYFLIRIIAELGFCNQRISYWVARRKHRMAHKMLCHGLIELLEGRWKQAEKHLVAKVSESETPLINYLMAARAAHEQQAFDRRDDYLMKAHGVEPDAKIAIGLTKANLQIKQKQLEQALATLQHLKGRSTTHEVILNLLAKLFVELGDWENLKALLPDIKKQKSGECEMYHDMVVKAYAGLASQLDDADKLVLFWRGVPKAIRRLPPVCFAYAKQLLKFSYHDQAEHAVYDVLNRQLDDRLLSLYGNINANLDKQYKNALQWYKQVQHNPQLLYVMGKLATKLQLWGQAKEYLEASLQHAPNCEVYLSYAQLLEKQGQLDLARQYYKQGLEVSIAPCHRHTHSACMVGSDD